MTLSQPRTVTCGSCGRTGVFEPPWLWPALPPDVPYFDARVVRPVCSQDCERKLLAKVSP